MNRFNYSTWTSKIMLWWSIVESVPTEQQEKWIKINAQLFNVINPLFTPLSNLFFVPVSRVHQFRVRSVHFILMTYSICMACTKISWHFLLHKNEGPMFAYLGRLHIPYMILMNFLYHLQIQTRNLRITVFFYDWVRMACHKSMLLVVLKF